MSLVYVQNQNGKPLMPTRDNRLVRILLSKKKAKVVRMSPFTIRLKIRTKEYRQKIVLGIDAGSKYIGVSASTETEELFCAEMQPRNDVVDLLSTRRELRRSRRGRKKRYRAPRFNNRTHSKHKGWLAPSIEVKIHNHIQVIKMAMSILPISKVIVETAEFDIHRLKAMLEGKPLPVGTDYQKGEMYDHYNVRQYVLWRDGYTCQCCGAHSTPKKQMKLETHHKESRKTGGDAPNNLITLCVACHDAITDGKMELPKKLRKRGSSLRDAAFMGIMRKTLLERLRKEFPAVQIEETYGYITKCVREQNGIPKSHTSDAKCIAGVPLAVPVSEVYLVKPVRRHNRQLHKQNPSKGGVRKANQCPKYVKGFMLYDLVRMPSGELGYIFGRRSSGSFAVRTLSGRKISDGISCKKLQLIEHPRSLLIEKIS